MKRRRWAAAIDVGNERKAPSEFRIWAAGENMTDFGPTLFTERSARDVMAEYERRGNKLSIDYEHLSVPERRKTDEPWRGGGYFDLEVRRTGAGPELWAVRLEWSDEARRQIEQGERRYFSPDYYQDEKTNEVVRLDKIALCTDPATHRLKLLAARGGGKKRTAVEEDDEKGENKQAADEPKSKGAALLQLLLALRDEVAESNPELKSKIDQAIMLQTEDEAAPVVTASPVAEQRQMTTSKITDPVARKMLASLTARLDRDSIERLVEKNRDLFPEDVPALELWAMKQTPDTVGSWIRAARSQGGKSKAAGAREPQRRQASAATMQGSGDGGEAFDAESIQLDEADRAVCKRLGADPKAMLNQKRVMAAREAGVEWEAPKV